MYFSAGNTAPSDNAYPVSLTDEYVEYALSGTVGTGYVYPYRAAFILLSGVTANVSIKDVEIIYGDGANLSQRIAVLDERVGTNEDSINGLSNTVESLYGANKLPDASRLNADTSPLNSTHAGIWVNWNGSTITEEITDGGVKIMAAATAYSGIRLTTFLTNIPDNTIFAVEFYAKKVTEDIILGLYPQNASLLYSVTINSTDYKKYTVYMVKQDTYTDGRFTIGVPNTGYAGLSWVIKDINIYVPTQLNELLSSNDYSGLLISVMGDSISTCPTNNAVEFEVLQTDIDGSATLYGHPTYYDIGKTIGSVTVSSEMVGVLTAFNPVSGDIGKTIGQPLNYNSLGESSLWWGVAASILKASIVSNVSWSGSSISSHEGGLDTLKSSYAWHDAQINKLKSRDEEGNIITPNLILIYRGTNDFSHGPYSLLSEYSVNDGYPDTDVITGGFGFKEAYALTIKKIRNEYPDAKIMLCTLNNFKRVNYSEFPVNNGANSLPDYNNAIRELADAFGCGVIELDKDGITFENMYPTYISDSATIPTHPNATGHGLMGRKAAIDIKKYLAL